MYCSSFTFVILDASSTLAKYLQTYAIFDCVKGGY